MWGRDAAFPLLHHGLAKRSLAHRRNWVREENMNWEEMRRKHKNKEDSKSGKGDD